MANDTNSSPSHGVGPTRTTSSNSRQSTTRKEVMPAPVPAMYWSKVKTYGAGPKNIRSHTMNVIGDYIYVFGGWDNKTCYNDVYVFDSDSMHWSLAKALGDIPPACRAHSATVIDRKLFIFGGGDGPDYFNDLYIFDADSYVWTKPQVTGELPGHRRAHSCFAYEGSLYLFGGGDGARALNDVYKLDIGSQTVTIPTASRDDSHVSLGRGNTSIDHATVTTYHWTRLTTQGKSPNARGYHTSNLIQDKLLVFGGSDGMACFSDIFILDLPTLNWSQVDCQPADIKRLAHTATQVGSYLFVISGHDGHRYSNDILLLNLVTMNWETRRIYGACPQARAYHATVLHDSRLFLHGGFDGHSLFSDMYILDLSGYAYLPQVTDFELAMLR
ncbi:hypothetical protein IWQ61_002650 [Dispira simplex]|nr:hypothetical protein IWQ61_002650 [Dispira simplex]